ncbi:MAG TPA: YqiA/YcfP family alpha/beta fold hydrolase [Burkholderiales bacterium]|nr:YqiA/YcfP family alpha/beta fold hydrolase [Burkholderiales bacterium]
MTARIVYVHGFNSSPASAKARVLRERLEAIGRGAEFLCPALPHLPSEASRLLEGAVAGIAPDELTLLGSSLGGYYATWIAERTGCRAVLVNPAVRPWELFQSTLGPQKNLYTGEEYLLTPRHIEELWALEVEPITRPERYLLLAATGDEVVDWRRAVEKYRGAVQVVVQGGDHGFSGFADYLELILDFAALSEKQKPA